MRDRRFVAEHRGGPLKKGQHVRLMHWAVACSMHVLDLAGECADARLLSALQIAERWAGGKATVGEARKASVEAHATARESSDPVAVAAARSVGHAVATAHMADHSVGAALYGLKAVKAAGRPVEEEREWQMSQVPAELKELIETAMGVKMKSMRI